MSSHQFKDLVFFQSFFSYMLRYIWHTKYRFKQKNYKKMQKIYKKAFKMYKSRNIYKLLNVHMDPKYNLTFFIQNKLGYLKFISKFISMIKIKFISQNYL